ncbi:hypothetical protein [Sporosarcina sp. A2]|uniref:hypothetical protein n=1 Tax=Sporosarcina sp. A2 TaxID=3393449 RepID=UPI003D79F92C
MENVIRFVVHVAWTTDGDKAYSVTGLDENYKAVAMDSVYVGPASQKELLRQWLRDVSGRLEEGQTGVVFTNHMTARTSRNHVSDFHRVHVSYSKDHGRTYRAGLQTAIAVAKREIDEK